MVRTPEMVALDLRWMIACDNVARERMLALLEKYGAEIVNESCRALMPINKLTHDLRQIGVPIIWVLHANSQGGGRSDWELFFNYVVADQVRERTLQSLAPGRQKVWSGLTIDPADTTVIKNRYSALIPGSSSLERLLRSLDIDTILIVGTETNICCEATARDAMVLDFKVVMVSDCCAALSDDEHRSALENIIQQFGDVMTGDEVLERLRRRTNL
jgi:ureidoacrylate peracid hydrolase